MEDLKLPAFNYYLDESDPDIVIHRRQDDSFVAAFGASGVTREGILEAAKEDYWEFVRAHAARQIDAFPVLDPCALDLRFEQQALSVHQEVTLNLPLSFLSLS